MASSMSRLVHGIHAAAARAAFEHGAKFGQLLLTARHHDLDFARLRYCEPNPSIRELLLPDGQASESQPLARGL